MHIIKKFLVVYLISISLAVANTDTTAAEPNTTKQVATQRSPQGELPVNPLLLSLMSQAKNKRINKADMDVALAKITLSKTPLNSAEQYLLLIVKALFEQERNSLIGGRSQVIITILAPAKKLEKQISLQQLSQPAFLQLHLLLATHYANVAKYELAYLEKSAYLKKYHVYRKNKRSRMLASLKQSFEVKDKKANNLLLESQNQVKSQRVAEVEEEKNSQQYNVTIVLGMALIFALLLLRQLKIRNQLARLSKTDDLTGIDNRSQLFKTGEKLVKKFAGQPSELSVLLLDFDHFKQINDNFGHHVGDKVLVIVSQLVQETMRSRDVFARLGGDEFVALLPYVDINKAKAIGMHISEKIAQYDFSSIMFQSKVTVSIGVATLEQGKSTFDDALRYADLALYAAKEAGRNNVVCYQHTRD